MHDKILKELKDIEDREHVKILYACESGSRAWGFESADSDYDVRFIYIRPRDWYLSIDPGRDVIERPIDEVLDVSGWDLPKALQLYRKSNPPMVEWLQSPICYLEQGVLAQTLRDLMPQYFSARACMHHYLNMARGSYKDHCKGETIKLKKYFYVLRPILACEWILADLGPVPMRFTDMVDRLIEQPSLHRAIEDLIAQKRTVGEMGTGPKIPVISQYIDQQMQRLESISTEMPAVRGDTEMLNRIFRDTLEQTWSLNEEIV